MKNLKKLGFKKTDTRFGLSVYEDGKGNTLFIENKEIVDSDLSDKMKIKIEKIGILN